MLWSGWNANEYKNHPDHNGTSYKLDGIFIKHEFITEEEEAMLMKNLDDMPWDTSQSGRRKQVNFIIVFTKILFYLNNKMFLELWTKM